MRRRVTVLGLLALAGSLMAPASRADEPTPEQAAFAAKVRPLLERHCLRCHNAEKAKGDLDLSPFGDFAAVAKDRKTWERVRENVADGLMPPPEEAQPTEEEVAFLTGWLEGVLSKAVCEGPVLPGHVTMRRLNRTEYDLTIRDLVGIDFHPSEDFPSDDVGYGFDNIGDVLTLSPLLLEKYLAAAEGIAARAIVVDRTNYGERKTYNTPDLRRAGGERHGDEGRVLGTNGELKVRPELPRPGEYLFRVRAYGQQAGDEPVKIAFRVDDKDVGAADVTAVEGDPEVYEVRATLAEAGQRKFAVAFLNDFYDETIEDRGRRDRNLIVEMMEVQGPITRDDGPLPRSHTAILDREPKGDSEADWTEAARDILRRFAARAFRRPVAEADLDRLVALVIQTKRDGENFARGIQVGVTAVLVSPKFLFRVEPVAAKAPGAAGVPLDGYAIASRLSYFLWSSMPDEELFRLAAAGKLADPAVLAAQATRMLKDPKGEALVDSFAMQWLQLRNLDNVIPNRKVFPTFDERLKADMREETRAFFAAVMREDRSVLEFLDSDWTFLNERLAKHYGIDGVRGDELRRVGLSGDRRGGVLTQASVLTVTSNPTRTSPVKRGKWVLEQILGTPPPPAPPNVPPLSEEQEAILSGSLRERLERHRADPGCASCHAKLDPLGFVFENYDAIGQWRTKDGAFDIDPSGSLPGGDAFAGPKEFKTYLLAQRGKFTRCLAEKLLTFALGRGLDADDACEVDRIAADLERDDYRFSTLVHGIVTSVPFRMQEGRETSQ
jgi:hypothetical protein